MEDNFKFEKEFAGISVMRNFKIIENKDYVDFLCLHSNKIVGSIPISEFNFEDPYVQTLLEYECKITGNLEMSKVEKVVSILGYGMFDNKILSMLLSTPEKKTTVSNLKELLIQHINFKE